MKKPTSLYILAYGLQRLLFFKLSNRKTKLNNNFNSGTNHTFNLQIAKWTLEPQQHDMKNQDIF